MADVDARPPWLPALRLRDFGTADVIAGIAVALVLLPQSLAYATLAGMPPATGLLVAVVCGVPAAVFASSRVLQTGPVAITALLTFGALAPLAEPTSAAYLGLAATLALMVGLIRVAIGVSRSGGLAYLMSEPVLQGFTVGAGVVIVSTQLSNLLGVASTGGAPLAEGARVLRDATNGVDPATAALGLGTAVVLVIAKRLKTRIPVVLIVVAASIAFVATGGYDGTVIGTLPALAPKLPALPSVADLVQLSVPALVIAVIGFGDVAAISRAYEGVTPVPVEDPPPGAGRWDADREFVAQGVANLASGIVGGFPVGGSFSRTAVAADAGARTPWTQAVASIAVLAALPAAGLLEQLPVATLAGIIVGSVTGLLDVRPLLGLRRFSSQQFLIALIVLVATLASAPQIQWALIIGVALSIGAHLRRELMVSVEAQVNDRELHLFPTGVLYFASAHLLHDEVMAQLVDVDVDEVVIHLGRLGRVDVTGALALQDVVAGIEQRGISVRFVNATDTSRKIVERVLDVDAGVSDVRFDRRRVKR